MILKLKKRWLFFFFLLSILFVASLILNTKAQGMGTYAPMLKTTGGPRGTNVLIIFNLTNFINEHEFAGSIQNAYGTEYKIGWDIGGYPTNSGAGLDAVRSPGWTVLGTAQVDKSGVLSTTVTIPKDAQIGDDHYIYAVPPNLEAGAYYWWDFFHVTGGAAVTPTPLPTSSPSPASVATPTPHPASCTMTVKWDEAEFHIEIQGVAPPSSNSLLHNSRQYSVTFPWGTTVSLYANHTGDNSDVFDGWDWTDSNGHHGQADQTVYIDLTSDVTAEPKIRGSSIPGFPMESIVIGLFISLGLLYTTKKRPKVKLPSLG